MPQTTKMMEADCGADRGWLPSFWANGPPSGWSASSHAGDLVVPDAVIVLAMVLGSHSVSGVAVTVFDHCTCDCSWGNE